MFALQMIYTSSDFNWLKEVQILKVFLTHLLSGFCCCCCCCCFFFGFFQLLLFCIYKIYLISAERYKNAEVDFLKIRKIDEMWVSMRNVHDSLGVKNMFDLVLKEIYVKYKKPLSINEIKKHKMTEKEIFKNII